MGLWRDGRMSILAAVLFTLTLVIAWLAQLVGLPGNWLIVGAARSMPGCCRPTP